MADFKVPGGDCNSIALWNTVDSVIKNLYRPWFNEPTHASLDDGQARMCDDLRVDF
ncbi:hypothetical protein BABINDRAFT_162245 [Babjeviella inositovora NRRL Y-12698]|uniref:Uncharacterized protein n=1 Tax=Babjeviella inositovora NRRL Y-12698 TaxID=984486 RepID=A0A1E3QNC3_9ASCO|nr:uncharacterized protein BABINDRAFT_162245 [Babjeviella inositovora NRRL Y-12698]ODQ79206.1 hypothetical protein BABINDRAFT_162245 [Babjeviella inositovora NRRL Y-12698]